MLFFDLCMLSTLALGSIYSEKQDLLDNGEIGISGGPPELLNTPHIRKRHVRAAAALPPNFFRIYINTKGNSVEVSWENKRRNNPKTVAFD